jgi:hypothetical protein
MAALMTPVCNQLLTDVTQSLRFLTQNDAITSGNVLFEMLGHFCFVIPLAIA